MKLLLLATSLFLWLSISHAASRVLVGTCDKPILSQPSIGSFCPTERFLARGVPSSDRTLIVRVHNEFRNRLARGDLMTRRGYYPRAANMIEMVWDRKLARKAQRHAQQCDYVHNSVACLSDRRFIGGQNLGIVFKLPMKKEPAWETVLKQWSDEFEIYPPQAVNRYIFYAKTAHFSQMAWSSASAIGCGYVSFPTYKGPQKWSQGLYVCNYGNVNGSNVENTPIHQQGAPKTACPNSRVSKTYDSLCAPLKLKGKSKRRKFKRKNPTMIRRRKIEAAYSQTNKTTGQCTDDPSWTRVCMNHPSACLGLTYRNKCCSYCRKQVKNPQSRQQFYLTRSPVPRMRSHRVNYPF